MIDEGTLPTQRWSFLLLEVRKFPSPDRARGPRLNHSDRAYSADGVEGYRRDSSAW